MAFLPLTLRTVGLLLLAGVVLPVVREVAHETLSQARECYQSSRTNVTGPSVARIDPFVLSRLVPFVPTARLLRRLVVARPMGP